MLVKLSDSLRYIYDPLGKRNTLKNISGLRTGHLIKNGDYYQYPYASQMKTTNNCGFFSLSVAKAMKRLFSQFPLASETDIDEMIILMFGKSPDGGDVKKIYREFTV